VRVGGRELAAGERVAIMWIAANRDGRVFEAPAAFRLDRNPADNLLYGAGIHRCPGAPLARLELRVVTEELLKHTTRIASVPQAAPMPAAFPAGGFGALPLEIE